MRPSDDESVGDPTGLLALYDDALPHVYGYLLARCGDVATTQDLTQETFLAAVDSVRSSGTAPLSRGWLIGVARHKLADHWRRQARERARVQAAAGLTESVDDPWPVKIDRMVAHATLERLAPQHRSVLTLRYLDDLSVPECARVLERTVHATEALLVRARLAFRRAYPGDTYGRAADADGTNTTTDSEEGHHG